VRTNTQLQAALQRRRQQQQQEEAAVAEAGLAHAAVWIFSVPSRSRGRGSDAEVEWQHDAGGGRGGCIGGGRRLSSSSSIEASARHPHHHGGWSSTTAVNSASSLPPAERARRIIAHFKRAAIGAGEASSWMSALWSDFHSRGMNPRETWRRSRAATAIQARARSRLAQLRYGRRQRQRRLRADAALQDTLEQLEAERESYGADDHDGGEPGVSTLYAVHFG
jgi:hypothetical protein